MESQGGLYCLFSFFFFFFFRPYSFQTSWGNLALKFQGKTVERQSCILCCLLAQGMLLWPVLHQAFWRRLPSPQTYRRCLHVWLKLIPTSFHYWAFPKLFLPGESPRPMDIDTEQFLFSFPYGILAGASPLGVHRHIPGGLSSAKSFECSGFTFGSHRWPHQNQLPLHHIKSVFPLGLRSCSWQMNQCAISLKANASPEFKERKMARELCDLTRWWTLQLSSSSHPTCNNIH